MGVTLALSACSSLPTGVERTPSYALADTSNTQLARQLQPLLDDHPGLSGFQVLSHGSDAFEVRLRLIHSAQKSIDAQYYIWNADLTGKVLYDRLLHAADRGVRVRLLLDDLFNADKAEMLHRIDSHPNIEIRLFNPSANRDRPKSDYLTDTGRVNHRMHSKSMTFDNQVAIFGGRNVGDEYFHASKELGFFDMEALAVGPIVQQVSGQFDLYWNSEWVFPLAAFPPDTPVESADTEALRQALNKHTEEAQHSEFGDVLRQLDLLKMTSFVDLGLNWSEGLFAYDQPGKVETDKVDSDTHLFPRLKQRMGRTRQELIIVSPYFVPGEDFTRYLTGLVDKGVRVRILTNSLQSNDVAMVHAGYMRYRKDLVGGGVELYEFKAVRSRELEEKIGRDRIGAYHAGLHAKFFGFDQRYLFIGSFNLDARSVALNTELGGYFESREHAKKLSEKFDRQIMLIAYRVLLNEDGKLEWVTLNEDGEELHVDKEPDTTFWKRFSVRFMSTFVPESQL